MKNTLEITTDGDRALVLTRAFDAPRALVFRAMTEPDLIPRWLGVHEGWSMTVCEVDLRVGGSYRYVWSGPDGMRMGMRGVYLEVVRPERIVNTEAFDESWYPGEAVETVVLVEHAGRTTLTSTVLYESKEALAAVLASPMESGLVAGYDALEVLVRGLDA